MLKEQEKLRKEEEKEKLKATKDLFNKAKKACSRPEH